MVPEETYKLSLGALQPEDMKPGSQVIKMFMVGDRNVKKGWAELGCEIKHNTEGPADGGGSGLVSSDVTAFVGPCWPGHSPCPSLQKTQVQGQEPGHRQQALYGAWCHLPTPGPLSRWPEGPPPPRGRDRPSCGLKLRGVAFMRRAVLVRFQCILRVIPNEFWIVLPF